MKIFVHKININKKLFFLFILFTNISFSQLVTTSGYTASDLVQNTLLGNGVQLVSVNFLGDANAIGLFNGASSNIGLNSGVVMTTGTVLGNANGPIGPNNTVSSGIDNGSTGYGLLNSVVGGGVATYNATVIEFEFIPNGDSINFKYVFASEEYKEFVGTEYNDVFGFFLSGPRPGGGSYTNQNLALVPSSITPVAINNVNHLTNSAYYVDNDPPGGATVQYDGFTRVLVAKASVIPCSTYRIILAIADVSDPIYDSGVFLEAKSFSSKGSDLKTEITGSVSTDSLNEGCGQANLTVTFTGNTSITNTIQYDVLGTATQGVDFTITPPGSTITFLPGQTTANLTINPINDGIPEGAEFIVIQLIDTTLCPNVQLPRDTIWLSNRNPLIVTARPDTSVGCNNIVLFASATISGGSGNVDYVWNNGIGNGNNVPFIANSSNTYVITATDQCGFSASDSFSVTVPNFPPMNLSFTDDIDICPGDEVTLVANASGGAGTLEISWSTGAHNVNTQIVYPQTTTLYSVFVTDSCGNSLTDDALVNVLAPSTDFTYIYTDNRTIQFNSTSSSDVILWNWSFGDGNGSLIEDPLHTYQDSGFYNVILVVENQYGCRDTAEELIYAYPDYVFYIPNTFTPNIDNLNPIFTGYGMGFIDFEMRIFNRWGEEIFYTNDIDRGWAGVDRNNRPCQIGVYAYKVDIKTPSGYKHKYVGHVNLLR